MSITDELRTGGIYRFPSNRRVFTEEELTAIADRIDAEHEKCINAMWEDAKSHLSDESLTEHGWVRLPMDADGEVVHIGELVDEKLPFGGYAAPAPIDTMELSRGASGYRWMVRLDAENRALVSPKLLRHHHAPTVEDVLREFAEKVIDSQIPSVHPTYEETIAEYAAKLRMAGDGE